MKLPLKIAAVVMSLIGLLTLLFLYTIHNTKYTNESIAKSKEDGKFEQQYKVEPNSFEFEEHKVQVKECWIEKLQEGDEYQLLLTFLFDSDPYAEANSKKHITLKNLGREHPKYEKSMESPIINISEMWCELLTLHPRHRYTHFLDIEKPYPDTIKLEVGSEDPFDPSRGERFMDQGITLTLTK